MIEIFLGIFLGDDGAVGRWLAAGDGQRLDSKVGTSLARCLKGVCVCVCVCVFARVDMVFVVCV